MKKKDVIQELKKALKADYTVSEELMTAAKLLIQKVIKQEFWIAGWWLSDDNEEEVEVKIYFGENPFGIIINLNAIEDER